MTDFKPGDLAMRGSLQVAVVAVDGEWAWVRYEGGAHESVFWRNLQPIPAHPIPSEPNTAWADKDDEVCLVDEDGILRTSAGDYYEIPEHYAPFTRLVREGSEREAAIREVLEYLESQGASSYSMWVADRFLSGADQ